VYLRKRQTFGSLQHAPQLIHSPFRFFETGSVEVKVLLAFADHVFLFVSSIMLSSLDKPIISPASPAQSRLIRFNCQNLRRGLI
jgi:hypothetical protein